MSGIAGVYRRDGRAVDPDVLDGMLAAIEYRGPDGRGAHLDGPVGLGHQSFRTTPEARHADQPLVSDDLAVTADARIDNRAEIARACDVSTPLDHVTDARLILAAYDRWGPSCPEELLGAYAFVVWDATEGQVLAARDHVGIKPLYYYEDEERFAFGSTLPTVLANAAVPRRIDEAAVADHLTGTHDDAVSTVYADVHRLPPARTLAVDASGDSLREYWSLDPTRTVDLESDEAYADRFRELFETAVACRLRSSTPVGTTLSGGLDSSAIACTGSRLLAETGRGPLHTFSAVFDEVEATDERSYVDDVLSSEPFESHFVTADAASPLADLETRLELFGQPFDPYLQHVLWHVYRLAGDTGDGGDADANASADVRVLLDGYDGDTVVSHGIGRLASFARTGRWRTLWRQATVLSDRTTATRAHLLLAHAVGPWAPAVLRALWRLATGSDSEDPGRTILAEDLSSEYDGAAASAPPRSATERHHRLLTDPSIQRVLEVNDAAAAWFGIEPRYPFFDRRLMEYCLALPAEQKLQDGWTRWILRRALAGTVPERVRWRTDKADFHPYVLGTLRRYESDSFERLVARPGSLSDVVDEPELSSLFDRFRHDGSVDDALTLARCRVLAAWCRVGGVKPETTTEVICDN